MINKLIGQLKYIKNWKNAWRLLTCEIKSLELAITYNCNFHCPGCYVNDLKEPVFMSLKKAKQIIDKYNPAHINITGGEPLLHKDVFKIIKYASDKGIIVSMVTNGSLLNEQKISKLKESGLNTLQLSYGKNYNKYNMDIARQLNSLNIFNVCLSVTNTYNNEEWIIEALALAKLYNYQVLFNLPMGDLEKDFDKETYFKYRNLPYVREDNMFWNGRNKCPAGTKKIYVSAKGILYPCDRLHDAYNSYYEMKKVYCNKKKTWCNRLGDIDKEDKNA